MIHAKKYLLNVISILLICLSDNSCQTNISINSQFNNLWILEDYYNCLVSDSILFDAYDTSPFLIKQHI
jgi:hypothetical protein